jgi:hypothetical protein
MTSDAIISVIVFGIPFADSREAIFDALTKTCEYDDGSIE